MFIVVQRGIILLHNLYIDIDTINQVYALAIINSKIYYI